MAPWRISLVLKEHRPPMLWTENMRFQNLIGLWRLFQAMEISQIPVSFCITKVCPARLLDGSCSWTALFGRVSKDKGYQRYYLRVSVRVLSLKLWPVELPRFQSSACLVCEMLLYHKNQWLDTKAIVRMSGANCHHKCIPILHQILQIWIPNQERKETADET